MPHYCLFNTCHDRRVELVEAPVVALEAVHCSHNKVLPRKQKQPFIMAGRQSGEPSFANSTTSRLKSRGQLEKVAASAAAFSTMAASLARHQRAAHLRSMTTNTP